MLLSVITTANAAKKYSPSQVFAGVEYANTLMKKILSTSEVGKISLPRSREKFAKPMHVYELHTSAIAELYRYAVDNDRNPPPLAISTPIDYTPTDVYYLTQLVINNLEEIYTDGGGVIDFQMRVHSGKTPANVYQELFELYYRLNLLNGKKKVTPTEVYAQIFRAKEDLQYTLLTMSKRLDNEQEKEKRLLITAIYGMHSDGSTMTKLEMGKKPSDVFDMALIVREKLNALRVDNKMPKIKAPSVKDFTGKIKPIDIFLQTQFIIAELNSLKVPMFINSTTNSVKFFEDKTPSDVYQEMKHIDYMLKRIIEVF